MIVPNKFYSLSETVLSEIETFTNLDFNEKNIGTLFSDNLSERLDIGKYILLLDVLFILEIINIDPETGIIKNVKRN